MLKATLESHDSNRTILSPSILDSESPIQMPLGLALKAALESYFGGSGAKSLEPLECFCRVKESWRRVSL